jgi:branched-chain amino acid transport system permease protein
MMATTMSTIDLPTYSQLFAIGIIALSLVPLVGFAGQISLCQLSFAGIGAVCMAHVGINGNPLGFVVAIVVCGVVGALVALPALRLQGIYLALATAAFAVFLDQWVFHLPDFDVGPIHLGSTTVVPHIMHFSTFSLGSVNVATVKLFGYNIISPTAQMILATVLFVICFAVVCFIRRSRFGRRLLAMRDSEAACATFGLDLLGTRLSVFAMSAAMAGLGGALYGTQLTAVTPDRFNFVAGLPIFMMVVVGGAGFASAGLFAGVSLNALLPFMSTVFNSFGKYQLILTGGVGIGLGREPSGAAPQFATGFIALREDLPVVVSMLGLMVVAWAGRLINLYPNWPMLIALFVLFVGAVAIASRRRLVARGTAQAAVTGAAAADVEEVPLEWVGVTVPWTPELLAKTEQVLGLGSITYEAVGAATIRRGGAS